MDQTLPLFPESTEVTINHLLADDDSVTISTAESCTGGNIAGRITSVAGSSSYFHGGLVAYDNEIKIRVLGVPEAIIRQFGAVSEQCAEAMASGAAELFRTTFAVSSTGIAGPGGGTRTKPVGLVYIGTYGPNGIDIREFHFSGDRRSIVDQSTAEALKALATAIEQYRSSTGSSTQGRSNP